MTKLALMAPPEVASSSSTSVEPVRLRRVPWPLIVAMGTFAALSAFVAFTSRSFLEADGATHYLFALHGLDEPWLLTDVWGRPLVTLLHLLPAQLFGLVGVRLTSLLVALGCALVAWRIAAGQGPEHGHVRPAVAGILTLASPLLFLHSTSELTELPFAFFFGLAFLAYQSKRWAWCALLAGLLPLGRPEGFGFLFLAGVLLVLHRQWKTLPLLVLPLVIWNVAGWHFSGRVGPWWWWLPNAWPYAGKSVYQSGPWLHFVARLPMVVGPFVMPLFLVGCWLGLRRATSVFGKDHLDRCRVLVTSLPLFVLIVHSVLYATGKMASNGEVRYLLCVAPFIGLVSARGSDRLVDLLKLREGHAWPALAAVSVWVGQAIYPVVPLTTDADWHDARSVGAWLRDSGTIDSYDNVYVNHPAVWLESGLSPSTGASVAKAQARPPSTLLVFDPIYSRFNADQNKTVTPEFLIELGWQEFQPSRTLPYGYRLFESGR